ncbi:hypothetical protein C7974DRAFT_30498 [Boeremia exigua]|uniref:uncharacterized protein n=1 Tax=Boeremia exigua TaxID=749465 RepID=UPI001E8E1A57|nr:uncharacterized protein C7974DRAFT_30498 [Boeremia exigua]KAH6618448.1 hypothetical protein C7974DRAFT_30498 [Boeremia exigua]
MYPSLSILAIVGLSIFDIIPAATLPERSAGNFEGNLALEARQGQQGWIGACTEGTQTCYCTISGQRIGFPCLASTRVCLHIDYHVNTQLTRLYCTGNYVAGSCRCWSSGGLAYATCN